VADRLAPGTAALAIAGHRSSEPAAAAALRHLGLRPLLDLDLRLGEGTGAALAFPLVAAAARALGEMADLPVI
jgi:nicotinate-nucleotide--dimethylbenzimidazole phosphoribosyltransferase